ncbi:MAG TPA: hypothetical protein ENI26_12290 [Methylophaga aminisulfidivorans]|uniref:Uncharacterized protein n=2 Tax=root TaxID=1 RepID=A0A7C1ZVC5_9GAMM|nr:hypothetical protein [Methylophaga aminisulfidivorans]
MKKWYKSRMIIVNMLTLAISVLGVFAGTDWIMANPVVAANIVSVIGALNVYLRLNTSKAIK